jgi:segregation and condensation protein A
MQQKALIVKKSLIHKKKDETIPAPAYSHSIKLPDFEGPLDLLLTLIKKNKINIYDIPINKITEDYLNIIGITEDNLNSSVNIDLGGDFIVMAAHLIYIKSLMLLPSSIGKDEASLDENQDPREDLVNMLLGYQKVKELSNFLENRPILGRDIFNINININDKKNVIEHPDGLELMNKSGNEILYEANVFILSKTFYEIIYEVKKRNTFYELKKQKFSIREKIVEIIEALKNLKAITLSELILKSENKETFVIYFLAILEMTRLVIINLQQVEDFGEIYISLLENSLFDYNVKIENIT